MQYSLYLVIFIHSGSSPLFSKDRAQAVDFIMALDKAEIKFVFRKPPLSYMANIFALPFYWTVWVSMVLILVLFAICLLAIMNAETKYQGKVNFVIFY